MARDLGLKHSCFKCGTKFYDLGKPEPICPKCGADAREKPAAPPPPPVEKRRPPPEESPEGAEAPETEGEEASEEEEEPAEEELEGEL